MYLRRVRERLVRGYYRSLVALHSDLTTLLANCAEYNNPDSHIVACARDLVEARSSG